MCFKLIKKKNNINSLSLHQFPDASINSVSVGKRSYKKKMNMTKRSGAPNDNFGKLSVRIQQQTNTIDTQKSPP